jgi:alpha-galactosidase
VAAWQTIAEVPVEREARVYEHGWQSWSPTTTYAIGERPRRPADRRRHSKCYSAEHAPGTDVFSGEGLLAVQPSAAGPVHVFAAGEARELVASIEAAPSDGHLLVRADGPTEHRVDEGPGGIEGALARWADRFAVQAGVDGMRRAPVGWCSWYHYFTAVTERDMDENLEAIGRLELPVEVVQLDDGYQAEIGDWLALSDRFSSLSGLIERIRSTGRRAGIWVAPFLAGARSALAQEHPDWLVGGPDAPVSAGFNWEQDLYALDTTHPGARTYLGEVFSAMRAWGIDYFKIDFIYAGAIPGRRHGDSSPVAAYRSGVELIRGAIGDAYLLGCGAPILPSVGLVDAMRISPDTGPKVELPGDDASQPSSRAAIVTGAARAFQQGRFWINDPDCLIVRPEVEAREAWAEHVERYGGLRASSDRLADLDEWGLQTTRRLLSESPIEPFITSG